MTKLSQVAKNFSENAKQQRMRTEKSVEREFKRLSNVIAEESKSAAKTSRDAIQSQAWKAAAWQTWSAIPLIVVFILGLGLGWWIFGADHYRIVPTFQNAEGVWTACEGLSQKGSYCLIEKDETYGY